MLSVVEKVREKLVEIDGIGAVSDDLDPEVGHTSSELHALNQSEPARPTLSPSPIHTQAAWNGPRGPGSGPRLRAGLRVIMIGLDLDLA